MNLSRQSNAKDNMSYELKALSHDYPTTISDEHPIIQRTQSIASLQIHNDTSEISSHKLRERPYKQSRLDEIEHNHENSLGEDLRREQNTQPSLNNSSHNQPTKFWSKHICPSIDQEALRDHLGTVISYLQSTFTSNSETFLSKTALERTFLGYLRTSLALATTGIFIAQLFRLQHPSNYDAHFGLFVIGRPLSAVFICMALVVITIGAIRFWTIQSLLILGKTRSGGWELLTIMALSLLVSRFP